MLRTYRILDELYQEFRAQLLKLRCVCSTWNRFSQSLLHKAISLAPSEKIEDAHIARAVRIIIAPFFKPCNCWLGNTCSSCFKRRSQGGDYAQVLAISAVLSAEILDDVDQNLLSALIASPHQFRNLISLQTMPSLRFSARDLHSVSVRYPTLVSLEFEWCPASAAEYAGLNFPNLRSLRIIGHGDTFGMNDWKVPKLTSLMHEFDGCHVEDTLLKITGFGRNLKLFSLSEWSRFDPTVQSAIWDICPNLLCFFSPVRFMRIHPPPLGHPLQYFRADDEDEVYPSKETVASTIVAIVEQWPTCRGVMGWFPWKEDFDRVLSGETDVSCKDDAILLYSRSERLQVGAQLETMGVRFEDMYGVSFSEARVKFGGARWAESITEYLEMVGVE